MNKIYFTVDYDLLPQSLNKGENLPLNFLKGVHSTNLLTSDFIMLILDWRDMSMNSVSVYIWRPPLMDESTVNSRMNSLPSFWGLDLRADITSAYSPESRSTADMIVIFSSLFKSWYSFWYLVQISLMKPSLLFSARTSKNFIVNGWKVATDSRAAFNSLISLAPTPAFFVNKLKDSEFS